MFGTLVQKELRSILNSSKFTVTFAICSILLLLSVFIGIEEYHQMQTQYETATELAEQRVRQATSWHNVADRVYRQPDPMQILVSGLNYDIGRWSEVSSQSMVRVQNSPYSDDPIFAVFRFIDFAFIVQVVFSLFAILFTFNAVNGERELGTLRLVFANAVPRTKYIAAKCVGSWLGLVVPLTVPILLSLLLILLYGIPMSGLMWTKVVILVGLSLLYVTLFTVAGVFVSTLSRHSNISFLIALVFWVASVLVIPRAGVIAASRLMPIPGLAEIEGRRDGYAKSQWATYQDKLIQRLRDKVREDGGSNGESEDNDEDMWANLMFEDSLRREVQKQIDRHEGQLLEEWNNRKAVQQRLGLALSRISPSSSYRLAAMTNAGTDLSLKSRYHKAMRSYREVFNEFVDTRQAKGGGMGGIAITFDSEKGMSISSKRGSDGLDLDGRPYFVAPKQTLAEVAEPVVVDFGIMMLGTILCFAGAFVRFGSFDLR